jgi:hypothetical protein
MVGFIVIEMLADQAVTQPWFWFRNKILSF